MAIPLEKVNDLITSDFNVRFANIMELAPDCAEFMEKKRPFSSLKHMHSTACDFIDCSSDLRRAQILRSHPDLAGRMAQLGQLTSESSQEQNSAGLLALTDEEREYLNNFNEKYKKKFGFPFIICARENKKDRILKGISERLNNTQDVELCTAVEEIKKITFYRILALVEHSDEENM